MRKVKIETDVQRRVMENLVSIVSFNSSPDVVLEVIDEQLKKYGYEIVIIEEEMSDYLFYVDKRR